MAELMELCHEPQTGSTLNETHSRQTVFSQKKKSILLHILNKTREETESLMKNPSSTCLSHNHSEPQFHVQELIIQTMITLLALPVCTFYVPL